MNQCVKVVTITWSVLSTVVCSPLPQNVETIPSIASSYVVSSTVDPNTIQLTTSYPQLPGQTVAIFRDAREVNQESVTLKDGEEGTDLPETVTEKNWSEDNKTRLHRNLAETENAGQNETHSTTENSEEADPEVKKSPITRDAREVNQESVTLKDGEEGTDLPETVTEKNWSEDNKTRLHRNLAETENAGQNETHSTTENSEEADPEVKKSPITSPDHNTDIYGKTTAEELADLSVIDILLRKRRGLSSLHQKQKRSLPETAGSDEDLAEEEEGSDEDLSEVKHNLGGSHTPNVDTKDENLNRDVKVTEHGHTPHSSGTINRSDSDTQHETNGHKAPEDKKFNIDNKGIVTGKSTRSVVSDSSARQDDGGTDRLNKSTGPVSSVSSQNEADKAKKPSLESSETENRKSSDSQAPKLAEKPSDSTIQSKSSQQTEHKSDLLESHQTKEEKHIDSVEKGETVGITNQNNKPLEDLIPNTTLQHGEVKNGTSLKRSTQSNQEPVTNSTGAASEDKLLAVKANHYLFTNVTQFMTEDKTKPLIKSHDDSEEDKQLAGKANHHLFTNVTRYTTEEKNEPLVKRHDHSEEETQTDTIPQKHESDEGLKLADKNTHSILSNVSEIKPENKSINVIQRHADNSESSPSGITVHEPHSLEITEGTARVRTNLNSTYGQELNGRNLPLEITEGTSQVSTNHEILHAVHKRSEDHAEVSNPNVGSNPHLQVNLHLPPNPYDDDKPHDVISVHKESRFSENRRNDEGCNHDNHSNVKRSDDEPDESRSSEENDNDHPKTVGNEGLKSVVPSSPKESHLEHTSDITVPQHISPHLYSLRNQIQTTGSILGESEVDNKNHEVDKRSRDDSSTDETGKAALNVQTVNVSSSENFKEKTFSVNGTSKSSEKSTDPTSHETVSPTPHDYSKNLPNVISKALHNEDNSKEVIPSSATEILLKDTDLQNGDKTGTHSDSEDEGNDARVETSSTEHEITTIGTEKHEGVSSTTIRLETEKAEASEEVLDGFKRIVKFIGF